MSDEQQHPLESSGSPETAGAAGSGQTGPANEPTNAAKEPAIVGYCRICGKALTAATVKTAAGTIYCDLHVPQQVSMDAAPFPPQTPPRIPPGAPGVAPPPRQQPEAGQTAGGYQRPPRVEDSPYTRPAGATAPDASVSPGLAFVLGLIPGVGAIYNRQYVKGFVHVILLGMLFAALDSANNFVPVFALMVPCAFFYMAFEAYHTARNRRLGLPVSELSSLVQLDPPSHLPVMPILLILFGVLFLLDNLRLLNLDQIVRYWPVAMIVAGVYLLWVRLRPAQSNSGASGWGGPEGPQQEAHKGGLSG